MSAYDILLSQLHKPRRATPRGGTVRAHRAHCLVCQADGRGGPSLSVAESDTGRPLTHCFRGCTHDEIMATAGIVPSSEDKTHERRQPRPSAWLSAIALLDGLLDRIAGMSNEHAIYIASTHGRDPADPKDREAMLDAVERWIRYQDNCRSYALGAREAAIEAMREGAAK